MFAKMAKSGNGQGSVSNLSATQNSFQINSKGSFKKLGENTSSSRKQIIDYKQVDFGYKNKAIVDMAAFLSDNTDLINLEQS